MCTENRGYVPKKKFLEDEEENTSFINLNNKKEILFVKMDKFIN